MALAPRPSGVRGNPGPFGLLCFGMTTCMLMFVTTTWSSGVSCTVTCNTRLPSLHSQGHLQK
ncbi:hypothetical protein V8C86DRAFT_355095 [Haematococcus lacustris]